MYLLIIICSIGILGNFFWYAFVFRNSYAIVTPGLKPVYNIFMVHLISTLLFVFISIIRPILWSYWDSDVLCHFSGKYFAVIFTFHHILITLFSYYKVQLYDELSRGRIHYFKYISAFGSSGIFMWCLTLVVQLIVSDTGPAYSNGTKVCFLTNELYYATGALSFFFLVLLNSMFIAVICIFGDETEFDIPELQYQTRMNRTIVPLIWSSSVFAYIIFLVMAANIGNNGVWILFWSFGDNVLNSIVMYWAIFGMSQNTDFLDTNQAEVYMNCSFSESLETELGSDTSDTTYKLDQDFYWISLPGAHPIKVTRQLVIENDLTLYIVSKRKHLKQIRLYRKRGFVPSLLGCCQSSAELADKLEAMGVFDDGDEDDKGSTSTDLTEFVATVDESGITDGGAKYFKAHE